MKAMISKKPSTSEDFNHTLFESPKAAQHELPTTTAASFSPTSLLKWNSGDMMETLSSETGDISKAHPVVQRHVALQRKQSSQEVHQLAKQGVQGPGGKLPYFNDIQHAFGKHDLSRVQAYTGATAAKASHDIGAEAYATGNKIAFADSDPSLHTVAHEAAHIVQQRAGVQLKNGVGTVGDQYERQADAIADKVVQGQSVENLLNQQTSPYHAHTLQLKPAMVQLAPLEKDRLNVVGEDHLESDRRRDEEKAYAETRDQANSPNYWTESTFRTRKHTFLDFFNDKRPHADPFELRFKQAQKSLETNAVIIGRDGDSNLLNDVASDNLESQAKFIHNLWTNLSNLNNDTDGFDVSAERKREMLEYRPIIKSIARTWEAARISLAAARGKDRPKKEFDWADDGLAVTSGTNDRHNFQLSVNALTTANQFGETLSELSKARSEAFHNAANNRSDERGVWKIGDKHASDMESIGGKRYNLVRQAVFNQGLTRARAPKS